MLCNYWYKPEINYTPEEALAGSAEVLANQLDPQSMADVMVDVILSDNPNFRSVYPAEVEGYIKQLQTDAWSAKS